MSSKTSLFRFVLPVLGSMLSAPLLCGCFLHPDVPLQPPSPTPAASDPPERGIVRGSNPAAKANPRTTIADKLPPAGTRALMLRGGWYRAPLTPEESVTGIYEQALAKQEKKSPPAVNGRYRHAGLEQFMALPAAEQTGLAELLSDSDQIVAVTAAVARARQGDLQAASHLIAAIENETLSLPARCAAVEALGQLPGDGQVEPLRRLTDRYGQFSPGASSGYQADLHAELLRALVHHVDAGDDPRFLAAVQVPSALVRIETLRAWAAGTHGPLPAEIVDLRSDDDPRVRAAALAALAARKHPAARDYLTSALHDVDLPVRLAAIQGLGRLEDTQAQVTLADLLKDRSELVRAEAVAAIAIRGSRAVVLGAAGDKSWRVRLKVAEALAEYGDHEAAATARRLLDDPSAEVERQVVSSVAAWPWEVAGPVLFEALSKDAVTVRRLAAGQVTARWPAANKFPFDAPPARRAEALAELQKRFQAEFGRTARGADREPSADTLHAVPHDQSDAQIEKLLLAGDCRSLAEVGPTVVAALERLAIDRKLTLPEPVYHDVLPRHSSVFAALDRMRDEKVDQRQRAAEELVQAANKQPLSRLAVARLCELITNETEAAVWLRALEASRDSDSEPAARMARSALGQASGEVRRRACEYLAAHPDPAHESFLLPLLSDAEQAVVVAAIRALGAAGQLQGIDVLKQQFASANEEVQLETAVALVHLRDTSGAEALERLSYSGDFKTRTRVAQALGSFNDPRLVDILIRLLDDPKATVSHAALASLPKAVGHDVGQSRDGLSVPMTEQMTRWKKWYAETTKHLGGN